MPSLFSSSFSMEMVKTDLNALTSDRKCPTTCIAKQRTLAHVLPWLPCLLACSHLSASVSSDTIAAISAARSFSAQNHQSMHPWRFHRTRTQARSYVLNPKHVLGLVRLGFRVTSAADIALPREVRANDGPSLGSVSTLNRQGTATQGESTGASNLRLHPTHHTPRPSHGLGQKIPLHDSEYPGYLRLHRLKQTGDPSSTPKPPRSLKSQHGTCTDG